MESAIAIVTGIISILQIFWAILLPRIPKAFGYLRGPILTQPALNWKLSEPDRASGSEIFTEYVFFDCYGQEPLDNDVIDRHPSVTYSQDVTILDVLPSDPKNIQPHITRTDNMITVEARWNSSDHFGMDIVFASKNRPKQPRIDARFIGVKEITSRLVTMRVIDWFDRLWRRFGPILIVIALLPYVLSLWLNQPGVSTPPTVFLAQIANGALLGMLFLVFVILPMAVSEHLIIQLRAGRRSNRISKALSERQEDSKESDSTSLQELLQDAPKPEVHAVSSKQTARANAHPLNSKKR